MTDSGGQGVSYQIVVENLHVMLSLRLLNSEWIV